LIRNGRAGDTVARHLDLEDARAIVALELAHDA
jgi:hypothetical protein